jgi:hypothetical protein
MHIWNECGTRLFEHSYRKLSADRWEVVKKDLQRVPGFKMVEQCLDRHACTGEDRGSAVDLGVDGDQLGIHGRAPITRGSPSLVRGVFLGANV